MSACLYVCLPCSLSLCSSALRLLWQVLVFVLFSPAAAAAPSSDRRWRLVWRRPDLGDLFAPAAPFPSPSSRLEEEVDDDDDDDDEADDLVFFLRRYLWMTESLGRGRVSGKRDDPGLLKESCLSRIRLRHRSDSVVSALTREPGAFQCCASGNVDEFFG